ncbi:MAG: tRNA (adenosine(37)-N6)-threonylcarbamoyltransferase complex ATPase subunit type 1 TsaE [Gammaproteobacteria bacterium AqS3]|nr:tRNA (adenosine(37)-N6)-threonylcarbamoyltransferase complex ATPase subunit type 1 TsaE [Gammaproteobacteria bacterium AqS3]
MSLITLESPQATERIGAHLAGFLRAHSPWSERHFEIGLQGHLGAGKTALARALIAALGSEIPATSPTYTLSNVHPAPGLTVCHVDCYRLGGPEDWDALGLDDAAGAGHLWLVEWPERCGLAGDWRFELSGMGERRELAASAGEEWSGLLVLWLEALGRDGLADPVHRSSEERVPSDGGR